MWVALAVLLHTTRVENLEVTNTMPDPASNKPEDSIEAPGRKLAYLPAVMGEYVLDVEKRLAQLRDLLAQERWAFQRTNITKAIKMYESGA